MCIRHGYAIEGIVLMVGWNPGLINDEPGDGTHSGGDGDPPRRGKQIICGAETTESRKHQEHDEQDESLLLRYQTGCYGRRFSPCNWSRSADVFEALVVFVGRKGEVFWIS